MPPKIKSPPEPMPVAVRVEKMRQRDNAAGLKRVEVLVPIIDADKLRAYAAKLRKAAGIER